MLFLLMKQSLVITKLINTNNIVLKTRKYIYICHLIIKNSEDQVKNFELQRLLI